MPRRAGGVMEINRRVVSGLCRAGLHVITVPPSAGVEAERGGIVRWNTRVIRALLRERQLPLIHGDAVLDRAWGFTIVSTEELFAFLAPRLRPARLILATLSLIHI